MNCAPRQRLRTKTGCLTCRSRRKKCDEKTPACDRCSLSGRSCQWPHSNDLVDRRYASHPESRYGTTTIETGLCLRSESASRGQVTYDLEVVISQHFIDKYYGLLLLPGCHPDFHNGWIDEIKELMVDEKSLRYSVLANAASHIYNIDDSSSMQHLALSYYSESLRGLASTLSRPKVTQLAKHNGVLMSVMLLYLHGCMGQGTYSDIPPHLNAAMNILNIRLFNAPPKISRPFDLLAVESVLYQVFLVSTGLWSDQVPLLNFNLAFWLKAEKLLEQSVMFAGQSNSLNSPVLGVPVSLFRLAIQAKEMYQNPRAYNTQALDELRSEIEAWQAIVLCDKEVDPLGANEPSNLYQSYYESASYLYALIISLLLEQMPTSSIVHESVVDQQVSLRQARSPPNAANTDSWQVQKGIQIIRRHQYDNNWAGCYMGNWPVYTLGFFLSDPEHINLIRQEMNRRWELTKFMQVPRFLDDLERVWAARESLLTSSLSLT
ncbi:Nn.00g082370.m01.CDS01 [Neocucurbitaria sp. VM-36]